MIDVQPPAHAYTRLQGAVEQARVPLCAWCREPYDYADAITWRSLAGDMEDVKTFHPECWGEALRPIQAKLEVAEQLGILPRQVTIPRRNP